MLKLKIFISLIAFVFLGAAMSLVLAEENGDSQDELDLQAEEMVDFDEDIEAEDLGVSDPTILPNSPFYFLKNWGRGMRSFFTFNPVKKAELKLRFANERLIEARKMVSEGVAEGEILGALDSFNEELEKIREWVEEERMNNEDPRVDHFLEKFVDGSLKQQRLLDKIENKLSIGAYERIEAAREKALENFASTSLKIMNEEKLRERLEKATEEDGSQLKHIKNLEVLMRIEEKVPEQAKEAIRNAQENTLRRLKGDLEAIPESEKLILEKYLDKVGGNAVRQLEIVSEIEAEENISPKVREMVQGAKEKVLNVVKEKIGDFQSNTQREKYLEHLEDGSIRRIQTIKDLEENLPPENAQEFEMIRERFEERFRERLQNAQGLEEKEELLEQIEKVSPEAVLKVIEKIETGVSAGGRELLNEMKEKALMKEETIRNTEGNQGTESGSSKTPASNAKMIGNK